MLKKKHIFAKKTTHTTPRAASLYCGPDRNKLFKEVLL